MIRHHILYQVQHLPLYNNATVPVDDDVCWYDDNTWTDVDSDDSTDDDNTDADNLLIASLTETLRNTCHETVVK